MDNMSIEHNERQMARIELYRKLDEARSEIRAGAVGIDAREVIRDVEEGRIAVPPWG